MGSMLDTRALFAVEGFLRSLGSSPKRKDVTVAGARHPAFQVDSETVVVHPKAGASYTRKTRRYEHGLRKSVLEPYAAADYLVAIYEDDTGSVLIASARDLVAAARESSMDSYEGHVVTLFFPRDGMTLAVDGKKGAAQ